VDVGWAVLGHAVTIWDRAATIQEGFWMLLGDLSMREVGREVTRWEAMGWGTEIESRGDREVFQPRGEGGGRIREGGRVSW
jgi:hypothetical protein